MTRRSVELTTVVDVGSLRVLTQKVTITLEVCHAREIIEERCAKFEKSEMVNIDRAARSRQKSSPWRFSSRAAISLWIERVRDETARSTSVCT